MYVNMENKAHGVFCSQQLGEKKKNVAHSYIYL